MVPQHVCIGIFSEMPDEGIVGLVYIRYQTRTLPANTAQHAYKLAKCFGAMSNLTPC